MQPSEEKIYNQLAQLRTMAFRPLNKILTSLGMTADSLSYLAVFLMVLFVFVSQHNLRLGFWLIVARMLADVLDGPLARYQKTASDRGKFVDVLMDNLGFALFIIGVVKAGIINSLPAITYLFATELVVVLMIIRFNLKRRSNWLFYASAGSFPYNFVYGSYLLYGLYAFGGGNYLNGAAQIFSILLIAKAALDYWIIQKIPDKKA
ncbi:CDP-alcohol phosphatidyltransferase family protein [Candidatus Saccharibacteria bacterium]|nr:CDP-alcohol phosphatidyltransferase family protein [Candidatus Saccharibacteria bacterium]